MGVVGVGGEQSTAVCIGGMTIHGQSRTKRLHQGSLAAITGRMGGELVASGLLKPREVVVPSVWGGFGGKTGCCGRTLAPKRDCGK